MPRVNEIPYDREKLYLLGLVRVKLFCERNEVELPKVTKVERKDWLFAPTCAYYRRYEQGKMVKHNGIWICLPLCAIPCSVESSRQWSWPGSTIDRTPCGVLAHELGHHFDAVTGERAGPYYSELSTKLMTASREKPLTGYAPNPAEWFAEMFRLYVTNPGLLDYVRPKTYWLFRKLWEPIEPLDWEETLGANVPPRVVATDRRKARA